MTFKKIIFTLVITVTLLLPSCKSATPLEALKKGNLNELKQFYQKGDKLKDLINKDDTFLTYSIKNNFEDIALWIINNKINDINATDSSENTPIMLSSIHNSKKVLKLLLKKKLK